MDDVDVDAISAFNWARAIRTFDKSPTVSAMSPFSIKAMPPPPWLFELVHQSLMRITWVPQVTVLVDSSRTTSTRANL